MKTITLAVENDQDLVFVLELAKRLQIKVIDTLEDKEFRRLAHLNLNKAYADNEPDYDENDMIELNPFKSV